FSFRPMKAGNRVCQRRCLAYYRRERVRRAWFIPFQRKRHRMGQFGFGQSVRRVEDYRLITGHGRYTDDITLGRQAHAVVVRSPYAHARIASIDTTEAAAAPRVLGVFTGADVAADGLGTVPCLVPLKNK